MYFTYNNISYTHVYYYICSFLPVSPRDWPAATVSSKLPSIYNYVPTYVLTYIYYSHAYIILINYNVTLLRRAHVCQIEWCCIYVFWNGVIMRFRIIKHIKIYYSRLGSEKLFSENPTTSVDCHWFCLSHNSTVNYLIDNFAEHF